MNTDIVNELSSHLRVLQFPHSHKTKEKIYYQKLKMQ